MKFRNLLRFRKHRLAFVEVEAFEDLGIQFDDLLTGETHLFVRVNMVAFVGQGLSDGFGYDLVQGGLVGVAELLVKVTDGAFGVLDQLVVAQNQMAGGGMRVQVFERVFVPVPGKVQDLIEVEVLFVLWFGELAAGVIDPRNGGRQHIQRVADEIDDARIREEFGERFDLGTEGWILGDEVFRAGGVQVSLQHGLVKRHDPTLMFRRERLVEMLVVRQFVHEREQKTDEEAIPVLQMDVLVLLGFEK